MAKEKQNPITGSPRALELQGDAVLWTEGREGAARSAGNESKEALLKYDKFGETVLHGVQTGAPRHRPGACGPPQALVLWTATTEPSPMLVPGCTGSAAHPSPPPAAPTLCACQ